MPDSRSHYGRFCSKGCGMQAPEGQDWQWCETPNCGNRAFTGSMGGSQCPPCHAGRVSVSVETRRVARKEGALPLTGALHVQLVARCTSLRTVHRAPYSTLHRTLLHTAAASPHPLPPAAVCLCLCLCLCVHMS
jgi:hypothetical protein